LTEKHPIAVTDGDFETFVMKSPLPVLLDCWAAWCGPCKMVAPVMEQLAAEWKGRVRIAKLDVDRNPQTAARFQVMSVPTFLIFDKGELKDTLTGALPKGRIVDRVQPHFL
jgi:thioredoxin 2